MKKGPVTPVHFCENEFISLRICCSPDTAKKELKKLGVLKIFLKEFFECA